MERLKLYHYWRSSASWRVRWGFQLKGIECDFQVVSLLNDDVDSPEHRARNPMGQIPVIEFLDRKSDDPFRYMAESLAILDWADRLVPAPALWPTDPMMRARAIELAEIINAGTQPIQNPTVSEMAIPDDPVKREAWNRHWIKRGLESYETRVSTTAGRFSLGDQVSIADLCLIPQVYNAYRFSVPMEGLSRVAKIYENAMSTPECFKAAPDQHKPKD